MVLRERADSLCMDLDSALQDVAQQAVDHQTLLDTKTRLEAEIRDYRELLDETSLQWYDLMLCRNYSALNNVLKSRRS